MGKSPADCGTNWVIHEYHPLVENPQVLGHAAADADLPSQPPLSSDWWCPEEDGLYLSELFDDENPKINCIMDENQSEPDNSLPHQRPYIICRLENKKDATPGCDVGEPSGSRGGDNISDFENPVAPSAISEVHSHREVNADLLSQPPLSSDWCFPEEDVLYLSDLFDDDQQINCVMDEDQPEPDNYLPHKGPYVTCHFEDKTNEMAGTPSCDEGEPSGPACMIPATENPVAPAAISGAHVGTEVNADLLSQPFLLPGDYFTEDDVLYFSDVFDDDQNINWVVDEFHPELENSLPHQGPSVISCLVYKTDEKAGIPGCFVGKPSGDITYDIANQVSPTAIQEVHSLAVVNSEKDNGMIFSNSFNDGKNNMEIQCGADEPEESSAEFVDGLIVDLHENNCGETTNNLFSNSIQLKSLKRSYFLDGPASVDTTEILPATKNPVAPAAISEFQAHVHTEVNADLFSQPFLPGGCYTEDDIFYYSDFFDDDQKINGAMDESHPEPENYLPHQGPHVISRFENNTDEMGGTPGCFIGKPSRNIPFDIEDQVAPPAIQEVHGLAEVNSEKENSMIFSNSFNDGHNMMQVQCGAEEPEESSAEFLDGLIVDPHENDCGETTKNRFNNSIQPKSLKRLYFPDGPADVDTNIEGVDGRVKRFRSFALGEQPR